MAAGQGRSGSTVGEVRGRAVGTSSHSRTPHPALAVHEDVVRPDPAACAYADCRSPSTGIGCRGNMRRKRGDTSGVCGARGWSPPAVPVGPQASDGRGSTGRTRNLGSRSGASLQRFRSPHPSWFPKATAEAPEFRHRPARVFHSSYGTPVKAQFDEESFLEPLVWYRETPRTLVVWASESRLRRRMVQSAWNSQFSSRSSALRVRSSPLSWDLRRHCGTINSFGNFGESAEYILDPLITYMSNRYHSTPSIDQMRLSTFTLPLTNRDIY